MLTYARVHQPSQQRRTCAQWCRRSTRCGGRCSTPSSLVRYTRYIYIARIRQHTSAYVSIRQHTLQIYIYIYIYSALHASSLSLPPRIYIARIRQHTSAYATHTHTHTYIYIYIVRYTLAPSLSLLVSLRATCLIFLLYLTPSSLVRACALSY